MGSKACESASFHYRSDRGSASTSICRFVLLVVSVYFCSLYLRYCGPIRPTEGFLKNNSPQNSYFEKLFVENETSRFFFVENNYFVLISYPRKG